jgi:hypothetical protein
MWIRKEIQAMLRQDRFSLRLAAEVFLRLFVVLIRNCDAEADQYRLPGASVVYNG